MEKSRVQEISKTIYDQIRYVAPMAFGDWGVQRGMARPIIFQESPESGSKAGLTFKPSGWVKHKGWIHVLLDEGKDTYEVVVFTTRYNIKKHIKDVYCDDLCPILDSIIVGEGYETRVKYNTFG